MVEQGEELLAAGARRGDDADPAGADGVGEAEPDAVDHGRAAVGPHHERVAGGGVGLERDLLGDRDVVAEDHHVVTGLEGVHRLDRGAGAGHRDQHDRSGAAAPERRAGRAWRRDRRVATGRPPRDERRVDGRQRGRHVGVVVEAERDDHVVGGGGGHVEAHALEHLEVEAGGHRDLRGNHAGGGLDGPADLQQRHRVGVRAGAELDVVLHAALPGFVRWSVETEVSASEAPVEQPGAGGGADGEQCVAGGGRRGGQPGAELGEHLAADRAVDERGGEQGGDAEATAYGSGERSVGLAERGPGGEPAGEHVVAQGRQAGTAAEQPVEVGGGEPAVGGQVEAGRHRGGRLGLPSDRRGARVGEPGDPQLVVADEEGSVADDDRAVGVRTEVREGRPQRAGHAGRGRGDHPEAPAVEVDVDRRGTRVDHRARAVGGLEQPLAHAGRRGHRDLARDHSSDASGPCHTPPM